MGHLALEKLLKACWVKNHDNNTPPKIHNLVKLYKETNFSVLNVVDINFLDEATGYNIEGRYPENKFEFYKLCTKDFTEPKLKRIKEIYRCILEKI